VTLYCHHASPLGPLLLVGERDAAGDVALTGVYLPEHRRGPSVDAVWAEDPAAFVPIAVQLDEYFAGVRRSFDLPIRFGAGSPFQRRVWEELLRIEPGETVTYAELAALVGAPGAARAVGGAVARNPISIVVPCHRVVGAGSAITGYAGGVDRKRALLALERDGAEAAAGTGAPEGAMAPAGAAG
jgi:methylated-DNA-[protein]-cysteine S-methyltransferase